MSDYTYVFRMVVLLRLGHSARVDLRSFVIGSRCAIRVLRNWRYVTGLYQDSPFYESVAPTDALRHIGCWCAVVSVRRDVVNISFAPVTCWSLYVNG